MTVWFGGSRHEAAYVDFAREAQHRFFRQAYLLTGDRDAAQDLVQETLLKLYLAWPRIEAPGAYGRKTLVREFLNHRRRSLREVAAHRLPDPPASPADPGTTVTLTAALAELPPRMRATVVLRFWEDLGVAETARALGCSEGTVKSATSKALAHLRARLGDTFDTPTVHAEEMIR